MPEIGLDGLAMPAKASEEMSTSHVQFLLWVVVSFRGRRGRGLGYGQEQSVFTSDYCLKTYKTFQIYAQQCIQLFSDVSYSEGPFCEPAFIFAFRRKGIYFFFFLRCFFFLPSNGLKFLTNSLGHSVPESSETGWRTGAKEIWCLHSDSSQAPR